MKFDFPTEPRFTRWRRIMLGVLLAGFTLVLGFIFYVLYNMPRTDELENPSMKFSSVIISADGKELGSLFQDENRVNIDLKKVPCHLQDALIATEDVRFYDHSGVDIWGVMNMILSGFTSVFGGQARGGSTLSQQLARNLYDDQVGKERSIIRKAKEAIVAVYLERKFTKSEIMSFYLNTVPFGGSNYGIQSAARSYFNKEVTQLSIEESALLVGMLKGPSQYNPYRRPKQARERRNTVLDQMAKYGKLTPEQSQRLKRTELVVVASGNRLRHNVGPATYFREYIREEVKRIVDDHNITIFKDGRRVIPDIYKDGLRIYTTIDSRIQAHAEAAVKEHLREHQKKLNANLRGREPWKYDTSILVRSMTQSERYRVLKESEESEEGIRRNFRKKVPMRVFAYNDQGYIDTVMSPWDSLKYYAKFLEPGLVSIDPQSGDVKAWVGGLDMEYFKYDHVVKSKRQVGSTFKPFVYAAAFDNNISPCKYYSNEELTVTTDIGDIWSPKNVDNSYGGSYRLKDALKFSINVIAARLIMDVNPRTVVEYAKKMGIESKLDPYYSIALGTFDMSVMEMTAAYACFAANGIYHKPVIIDKIETKDGLELYSAKRESRQALNSGTSYIMTQALREVVTGGTAGNLHYQFKVPTEIQVCGKTGTTQDYTDGWFVGFTPLLATGVWVGCGQPKVHFQHSIEGQGGFMAMPIFARLMKKIYEDKELNLNRLAQFPQPTTPPKVSMDCSTYVDESSGNNTPKSSDDNQHKTDDFY
jgi:penicillin-binding protein 1A